MPFEEWLMEKKFSENVRFLFNEAFICYKNTAYRASLLFSHLAFMTSIKELIINSKKPANIQEGRWNSIINDLQNDDKWEKAVYDELINSSSPIFNINEDLRQQIKYWKDRRNDCAHFKSNDILYHHTEVFWSFVKSNFLKITLEGGKESLLNKFKIHYNNTFTPPNADVTPLISEIEATLKESEFTIFWEELFNKIDKRMDDYGFYSETNATRVIKKIFENCKETTIENLAKFLKDKKLDVDIIKLYPDKVNFFNYSSQEVRNIWKKRILDCKAYAFKIYATLLRNSLIPQTEIEEANKHMIDKLVDYWPEDEITHESLASNGFGNQIFEIAIKEKRLNDWYKWVNPRADMIAYYIEKYKLLDDTVEVLCEMYTRKKYSYWLNERLIKIFSENECKKQEFHSIAKRLGFSIPKELS